MSACFVEYSSLKELFGIDFVLYVSDHGHSHGGHGHSHGMGKIPVLILCKLVNSKLVL